jgi:hypothetical protein
MLGEDIPQFFALQDHLLAALDPSDGLAARLRLCGCDYCGFQIFSRRELTSVENDGVRDERIGHRPPLDTATARCTLAVGRIGFRRDGSVR